MPPFNASPVVAFGTGRPSADSASGSAAGVVCLTLPRCRRRRRPGALALLVCSAVQPLPRECRGQLPLRPVRQVLQECELVAPAPVLPAPVAPAVSLRVLRQVVYDQVVSGPAHPERPSPTEQGTVRQCPGHSPGDTSRRQNVFYGASFRYAYRRCRKTCWHLWAVKNTTTETKTVEENTQDRTEH